MIFFPQGIVLLKLLQLHVRTFYMFNTNVGQRFVYMYFSQINTLSTLQHSK
jgi:hypothetical protein